MNKLTKIILVSALLAGCDTRRCIRDHEETILMPNPALGNIATPYYVTECDEYESREKPQS